jgi:hypothetical protein
MKKEANKEGVRKKISGNPIKRKNSFMPLR